MDLSYVPGLAFFGVGVLTGVVTVVKAIQICLEKFRPQAVYMILGMMLGSFYAILQGPTTLASPAESNESGNFSFSGFFSWCCIGGRNASVFTEVGEKQK